MRAPVPAILVSRLGIEIPLQGRGLGTSLLVHAMGLAAKRSPALDAAMLVAHAESDPARVFCARFGFEPFRGETGSLYLPLRDFEATHSSRGPPPRVAGRSPASAAAAARMTPR